MLWTAPTPLDYFASLVADDDQFALTEAAASLAQDEDPTLDIQAVLATLDAHAQAVLKRLARDAEPLERVRALHQYLYVDMGLGGNVNDFYSPSNSWLHEVLRTRRGIPISLAVIYLELAGQIGLDARGVSFPGHFLIRLRLPLGDALIDPLNGQSMSRQELETLVEPYAQRSREHRDWGLEGAGMPSDWLMPFIEPAEPREIVSRMLRNLESLHRAAEDWGRLLKVQQRLVTLLPDDWSWRRERGQTLARLGQNAAAIEDLACYLRHQRGGRDRAHVQAQLEALRESGPPRWH
ncbi:SirB1 family protein [Leptothrix discophora]|uniref:Tetratricopeptide repeat protein n=1 Tax=Leptothrix discophora TaxID=89 RepID=A0ABT9G3A0_LEPDI|nr:tetratricopeptide repeat protein [Leptothrix discophora]MDP4300967.1 tetratricopeptide repeat protein [Leptothrix discophora]